MKHPMKEALSHRKAAGLDITILIGEKENEENKEAGLAPEAEVIADPMEAPQAAPQAAGIEEELAKAGLRRGSLFGKKMAQVSAK